jgi:hypothetical protein
MIVAGGCSDGEMSLNEYVERLSAATDPAIQRGEELVAESEQITDFTPQHLQAGLERALGEIRIPLQKAADAIVEEALAARAGIAADTAVGWEELSESHEMAAYRAQLTEGKQVCSEFQAELEARAAGGGFAIDSWLAVELEEIGKVVLGCESFPEHPADVYRYPPPTSTS